MDERMVIMADNPAIIGEFKLSSLATNNAKAVAKAVFTVLKPKNRLKYIIKFSLVSTLLKLLINITPV